MQDEIYEIDYHNRSKSHLGLSEKMQAEKTLKFISDRYYEQDGIVEYLKKYIEIPNQVRRIELSFGRKDEFETRSCGFNG